MKKIKLRGQELKRLGFTSDQAIAFAINLVGRKFRRSDKVEILETLERICIDPQGFLNDPNWGELAGMLVEKPAGGGKRGSRGNRTGVPEEQPLKGGKKGGHAGRPGRKVPRPGKAGAGFKIYGEEQIDPEAIRQMETAMRLPVSVKGALMADAHVGYGLPIGGVLATYNAVLPYAVGMDIGCRMCLSVYPSPPQRVNDEREEIRKILLSETRFGLGEFREKKDHEILERKEFREIKFLKSLHGKFADQLGTSGHGNHFVDVGYVRIPAPSKIAGLPPGEYFAVLSHSGSRNFGAEVCRHYTGIAREKLGLTGEAGLLAWLELGSEEGEEYWAAMNLAGDYSHANHRIIHRRLAGAFDEEPLTIIENHHNFAWKERLDTGEQVVIHRKGATPAGIGDTGIIPGTMASPAFIVMGKGNEESLNSASHGAGRKLSRKAAMKTFTESQLGDYLKKMGVELLGAAVDESPFAYKDIHEVMEYQRELVEVIGTFHPKIVRMA